LAEFGNPRQLPKCGGWILERQIPGTALKDGMGCYPLFACRDWSNLHSDLEDIGTDIVSLALVTDPFGDYDVAYLQQCFDFVKPFKEHFVADLSIPRKEIASKHHRKCVRRSSQQVTVERCESPEQFLDDWMRLYDHLKNRHAIDGIRAFSRRSFSKQLAVPGIVLFRILHEGATVGANLFYMQADVAYVHLSALNPKGYDLYASYAVKWVALDFFFDKVRWLDLGAGAGIGSDGQDGLSAFKRGWSTGTRTAYFCGRIFDKERYAEIVKAKKIPSTDYFPAYRNGEFS
jgi:hypothetical protein